MPPPPSADVIATIITRARHGDREALAELMPFVYDELRRLARGYLARERPGHTLQPTALVNEAYLRLLRDKRHDWQTRTHFVAIAALSMRQILVEHARARGAEKRGGGRARITLDEGLVEGLVAAREDPIDLLAVDVALTKLAMVDPRQARLVELRFFGGLTIEESAEALGISPATAKRDWAMAKAWLHREITSPLEP